MNTEKPEYVWREDLKSYLLSHEDDIYHEVNDFTELRRVFFVMFGRDAKPL